MASDASGGGGVTAGAGAGATAAGGAAGAGAAGAGRGAAGAGAGAGCFGSSGKLAFDCARAGTDTSKNTAELMIRHPTVRLTIPTT